MESHFPAVQHVPVCAVAIRLPLRGVRGSVRVQEGAAVASQRDPSHPFPSLIRHNGSGLHYHSAGRLGPRFVRKTDQ